MSHVLITGPIQGELVTADGRVYDVSPESIVVDHLAHAEEIAHLIGEHWRINGHPHVDGDFIHDHRQKNRGR